MGGETLQSHKGREQRASATTVCFVTTPATRSPAAAASAQSAAAAAPGSVRMLPCTPLARSCACDLAQRSVMHA